MNNSSSLRILVVDDEPLIRWSLAETFVESGHVVTEANDRESALNALTAGGEPFHVVLLDYRLSDSNDLNLLSTVRRLTPTSAVIMMTAYGTPEIANAALKLGAYRVVSKPFEVHEMAELVLQAYASASQ